MLFRFSPGVFPGFFGCVDGFIALTTQVIQTILHPLYMLFRLTLTQFLVISGHIP